MDHLRRPYGTELSEEDQVPYLSSKDYHGVPFLEYPKRNQAYQVGQDTQDAASMHLHESNMEIHELERFLQTWLFFGLLQETLGDVFNHGDYVDADFKGCGVVTSTRKLPEKLKQWMLDPNLKEERLTHLCQCFEITYFALIATPSKFDTKVKIGIAASAEVISTALIIAMMDRNMSTELSALRDWGSFDIPSLRAAEMRERRGWCPAQASSALTKFRSLQSKIYLSQITKPYGNHVTHNACSFEDCRALQIDPLKYESLHLHSGTCKDVEANQEEVVKALKNGKNALLDLGLNSASGDISVTVVEAKPDSWYVALSHVWADGLGNTKENALPQCQLRRIYQLLTNFCTEELIEGGQLRPYVWLDTLCCPVDPQNKLLALAKLPEVYREASQVLVLDSSLTMTDSRHLEPIEVMARVFTSGWIFRLWTLNEANLASKLWVQFRDGTIELGQVYRNLSPMEDLETYHFTSELEAEYRKVRIQSATGTSNRLWYLTEALRCRSVSEVSDEPICLGAILQLDVGAITGEDELLPSANQEARVRLGHQRMARVWQQIVQSQIIIPKTFIYYVGDRLTEPGLRWAPSTLLNVENASPFHYSARVDHARPSTHGLLLSSAAVLVSVPERVDSILGPPSKIASTVLDLLKYDEHNWLVIFSTLEQKRYPPGYDDMGLYDIIVAAGSSTEFEMLIKSPLNQPQGSFQATAGLLVENVKYDSQMTDPDTRNARFLRQGRIWRPDQATCSLLNRLFGEARTLQGDPATQELREASQHGAQDPRYRNALQRLIGKVEVVVDQLDTELKAAGTQLSDGGLGLLHDRRKAILALLSRFYRNRYLVRGQEFPCTQQYCVD